MFDDETYQTLVNTSEHSFDEIQGESSLEFIRQLKKYGFGEDDMLGLLFYIGYMRALNPFSVQLENDPTGGVNVSYELSYQLPHRLNQLFIDNPIFLRQLEVIEEEFTLGDYSVEQIDQKYQDFLNTALPLSLEMNLEGKYDMQGIEGVKKELQNAVAIACIFGEDQPDTELLRFLPSTISMASLLASGLSDLNGRFVEEMRHFQANQNPAN